MVELISTSLVVCITVQFVFQESCFRLSKFFQAVLYVYHGQALLMAVCLSLTLTWAPSSTDFCAVVPSHLHVAASVSLFHALFFSEQHRAAKAWIFRRTSFFNVVHCQCVSHNVHRTTFDLHINVSDQFPEFLKLWSSIPPQSHHYRRYHHYGNLVVFIVFAVIVMVTSCIFRFHEGSRQL